MKNIVLYLFIYELIWFALAVEKITYISVEHPRVTFIDNKTVNYVKFACKRYGRNNPVYYVDLSMTLMIPFDNNVHVDFYFYEYLTNVYKRSFVEMHYKYCDLIHKDMFFGPALREQSSLNKPCPHPPGEYHFTNMSIPPASIPSSFPFKKGRIVANFTLHKNLIGAGHIDMEIKELKRTDKIMFSKI